jgi:hypothetical protein
MNTNSWNILLAFVAGMVAGPVMILGLFKVAMQLWVKWRGKAYCKRILQDGQDDVIDEILETKED